VAARRKLRSLLRKARDSGGQPLVDASTEQILGAQISYVAEGAFVDPALAVVGDYSMAVVGVRQDLTYKLLDQAVITDDAGAIVYNLPQQDMLALRVVARFGFAIAKPVSRNVPEAASRSRCSTAPSGAHSSERPGSRTAGRGARRLCPGALLRQPHGFEGFRFR
jgi:hypothetical protein